MTAGAIKFLQPKPFLIPRPGKKKLSKSSFLEGKQLQALNEEYTDLLAEGSFELFFGSISSKRLDAVCSHGHTVKHEPENGYTLQIGNLPKLANKLGAGGM